MELSPKQLVVEYVKNASRIMILGQKAPDGDFLGAALALAEVLREQGKTVEMVVSEPIPALYNFLPFLSSIKKEYVYTPGKVIKIDMKKFPAKGMKWQKEEDFLNIYLDAEKNLKFEYLEIVNGQPKPDLMIVLDTPTISRFDDIYRTNADVFAEVPVINIDHHAGNEYFGSVNLVDLTAASTAEILVALMEALGVKITSPDIATCLLTGIICDTQSFRSSNTTPKSLTVAAQLLAAGARQQEIISNLYKKRPMMLLKLWKELVTAMQEDKEHKIVWTKVSLLQGNDGIVAQDVLDATEEVLASSPDAEIAIAFAEVRQGEVDVKIKGTKGFDILPIAKIFNASGTSEEAQFKVSGKNLSDAELSVLKKLHDHLVEKGGQSGKAVWEVMTSDKRQVTSNKGQELSHPETIEEIQGATEVFSAPENELELEVTETPKLAEEKPPVDPIDHALNSISRTETPKGFSSLKEVIEKKKGNLQASGNKQQGRAFEAGSSMPEADKDIDVFDEGSE